MSSPYFKCLKSESDESGSLYGQFLIDSLSPGQGITIGNLLRRILLNDIGGTSITAVRIAGAKNEFSLITGVREDILELLLNLKGIILKSSNKETKFGHLKIQGPSVITAGLINLPENLKIINPDHYIATISSSNILEIEFKFEYGTGYKLAMKNFQNNKENFLQIDAVFMPIQQVDFKVENIYDNSKETEVTERLILDIWTNGSILPEDAIADASKFIIDLFKSLTDARKTTQSKDLKTDNNILPLNPHTNIAIEELQLSVRAYNCLKRAKINTIGDLLKYSPEKLQELRNFGRKSADEVFMTLKNKFGIIFK
ncbi:MAG: DNA-directed RNA polymerase subunit alpha [Pelagibacterales bacterium]|nr:DNA-directed RNA polymerase subunit alpha [Pelagibacterales bacterium]